MYIYLRDEYEYIKYVSVGGVLLFELGFVFVGCIEFLSVLCSDGGVFLDVVRLLLLVFCCCCCKIVLVRG